MPCNIHGRKHFTTAGIGTIPSDIIPANIKGRVVVLSSVNAVIMVRVREGRNIQHGDNEEQNQEQGYCAFFSYCNTSFLLASRKKECREFFDSLNISGQSMPI